MATVTHTLYCYGPDDEEVQVTFPALHEVCPRCRGEGKHTNPAIDGNGLSREDFDADPDFEEDYFAGVYDVPCEVCHGLRVIAEVDEKALNATQREQYRALMAQWDDDAECEAIHRAERAMGA